MKNPQIKFNMCGYLIEYDKKHTAWIWMKWEYAEGFGRKKHVVRKSGTIEFMKMSPSVFSEENRKEMYRNPDRYGVNFIFLYQGQTMEEERFNTIEEAGEFHKLDTSPSWDLTEYWFGYDNRTRSWGMYDSFTGRLEFTPQSAVERMAFSRSQPAYMKTGAGRRAIEHTYH